MTAAGGGGSSQDGGSGSSSSSGSSSGNGTFIESNTRTDLWTELSSTLNVLITGVGRKVVVSPQSGLVTVHAYPDEIRTVRHFLEKMESRLQRQVILEAKIVVVNLSDAYQQGIEWQSVIGHLASMNLMFSTTAGTVSDIISSKHQLRRGDVAYFSTNRYEWCDSVVRYPRGCKYIIESSDHRIK